MVPMTETPQTVPRVVLGIAGGSGSGKSWLAKSIAETFPGRSAVICHDWYYKNHAKLAEAERVKLNFDHPESLESSLMRHQLDRLISGESVEAPIYEYATHTRRSETRRVEPKELLILDGILILHEKELRDRRTLSVFIDAPDDIRLMRRVRRDCKERHVELEETLRLYEDFVRPMHHRFVVPSSHHATWIWSQVEDRNFPELLIRDLRTRLDGKVSV
jgi:uridine kinase